MSRAFVGEHDHWGDPGYRVSLPPRDDPGYDAAAAAAILEAAREGQTGSAEMATGYYWGEPKLNPAVQAVLERARASGDERLVELCERWLQI
jgi:hypothetical protein